MKVGNWRVYVDEYLDADGRPVKEIVAENVVTGIRVTFDEVDDDVGFSTDTMSGYISFDEKRISYQDKHTGEIFDIFF
jgi:hypothetical protein